MFYFKKEYKNMLNQYISTGYKSIFRRSFAVGFASFVALSGMTIMGTQNAIADGHHDNTILTKAVAATQAYRSAREKEILEEYMALLSLPNHGSNHADMRKNAAFIMAAFEDVGVEMELLELDGAPPAIFGEWRAEGASKTVVIYVHYDGQTALAENWNSDPFSPIIRAGKMEEGAATLAMTALDGEINPDWRIYARSASDDKAPIAALLTVMRAFKENGLRPSVNVKFFFEGEEEMGSPNLQAVIEKYQDKLASDYWLFFDGPRDSRGNARVVLGVRGSIGGQLTVYGPASGLHSGHYGNFAPNPVGRLAHLLASMRDEDGRVLIDGFYDKALPPDQMSKDLIEAIPPADDAIMDAIQVAGREHDGMRYEETHMYPALNFQGIEGGGVGARSRNVIVPRAYASLGMRIVPNMTKDHTEQVIEDHIRAQGYHIVREDPDLQTRLQHDKIIKVVWAKSGYSGVRVSPDEENTARLIEIMQWATDNSTLVYPILGGSLPLAHIVDGLRVPLVVLPIANQDNSQHAPNENIRIGNLWQGMELYAAILAGLDPANMQAPSPD